MKKLSPEDPRELRSSKAGKKLSSSESKGLRKFKKVVVWFIVVAFVMTSGVLIAGIGRAGKNGGPTPEVSGKPVTDADQNKKKFEADVDFWMGKIKEEPQNSQNYYNLADTYMKAGKLDEAVKYFKKAIEIDPKDTLSMKYLAMTLAEQKKYKEALEILTKAQKIEPKEAGLYAFEAEVYYRQKKFNEAAELMKKAIKLEAGETRYYVYLAQIQIDSKKEKDARKTIKDGIEVAKATGDSRMEAVFKSLSQSLDKKPEKGGIKKKVPGEEDEPETEPTDVIIDITPAPVGSPIEGAPSAPEQPKKPKQPGEPVENKATPGEGKNENPSPPTSTVPGGN
jgi:tetratricopeptide (TPR) repeat protein